MKYNYWPSWQNQIRQSMERFYHTKPENTCGLRQIKNRSKTREKWVRSLGKVVFNRNKTTAVRLYFPEPETGQGWLLQYISFNPGYPDRTKIVRSEEFYNASAEEAGEVFMTWIEKYL